MVLSPTRVSPPARKVNARVDISINHPDVLPLGNNGTNMLQNGTAALSCSPSNPMTSVTMSHPRAERMNWGVYRNGWRSRASLDLDFANSDRVQRPC
jgi:hypothetical protein